MYFILFFPFWQQDLRVHLLAITHIPILEIGLCLFSSWGLPNYFFMCVCMCLRSGDSFFMRQIEVYNPCLNWTRMIYPFIQYHHFSFPFDKFYTLSWWVAKIEFNFKYYYVQLICSINMQWSHYVHIQLPPLQLVDSISHLKALWLSVYYINCDCINHFSLIFIVVEKKRPYELLETF